MLDRHGAGRVLEKNILNRLEPHRGEGVNDLSSDPFGFWKVWKSTVDAILSVTKPAEIALQRKGRGIRYCAVVARDRASWAAIVVALLRLLIPGYLYKILESYFQNRILANDTEMVRKPQEYRKFSSWVMHDEVLRLKFPVGVAIVGFADDISLQVYGEPIKEMKLTTLTRSQL